MTTRRDEWRRRIAFGLMLAGVAASAVLAFGTARAAAAPVATHKATSTCWKDVVNDWLRNQPNVVGTYAIPCYTQAIQHLNKYPDIQQYSNAPDDIHRALLAAMRKNNGNGPGSSSGQSSAPGPSGGSSSGGSSGSSGGKSPSSTSSGSSSSKGIRGTGSVTPVSKSFVTKLFDSVGPGNAESIPLPLLVLAGLAILLLLAAVATWLAKWIQARRMAPAPAPAERR
jgi:hypothetical protein